MESASKIQPRKYENLVESDWQRLVIYRTGGSRLDRSYPAYTWHLQDVGRHMVRCHQEAAS